MNETTPMKDQYVDTAISHKWTGNCQTNQTIN